MSEKVEIELIKTLSSRKLRTKVEKRVNELIASNYEVISISFSTNLWRVPICYITKKKTNQKGQTTD